MLTVKKLIWARIRYLKLPPPSLLPFFPPSLLPTQPASIRFRPWREEGKKERKKVGKSLGRTTGINIQLTVMEFQSHHFSSISGCGFDPISLPEMLNLCSGRRKNSASGQ